MKRQISLLVLFIIFSTVCPAQRGVGNKEGIVRAGVNVEPVELSGNITDFKVGECKLTTGRSLSGTHVIIKTSNGKSLNVHLGPTRAINSLVGELQKGKEIKFDAFRTNELPEDQYIAREIIYEDETYTLRDENYKPAWSGGDGKRQGRGRNR